MACRSGWKGLLHDTLGQRGKSFKRKGPFGQEANYKEMACSHRIAEEGMNMILSCFSYWTSHI